MGKRIDDLQTLDDTAIEHRVEVPAPDPATVQDQPWYQFSARLDELLADDRYVWAIDTLSGIKETVERTQRVSEGQQRAIDNIEARGDQRQARWQGRGYGGRFGSRWGR